MEDVECIASSAYPGDPRAVHWEGRRIEIERVVAQWRTPQGICYRAAATDGLTFVLCYDETAQHWQIEVH